MRDTPWLLNYKAALWASISKFEFAEYWVQGRLMRNITLKHLRFAASAARLGSFAAAAEANNVTPPAVTMQIPVHRGQSFRRIADSIPVIADSF